MSPFPVNLGISQSLEYLARFLSRRARRRSGSRLRYHFERALRRHPGRLKVLFEGDSWLDYPLGPNLGDQLEQLGPPMNALQLDHSGDEWLQIMSGPQLRHFSQMLKAYPWDIICISAGGNDLLGASLDAILAPTPHTGYIDQPFLANRLSQLRLAWQHLIHLRDTLCPQASIITHTYDYPPPPDGAGARWLGHTLAGPWIKPAMDRARIPEKHRQATLHAVIDHLADSYAWLQRNHDNLHVVDTRGALKPHEWADEIHPTAKGFRKLAARIAPRLHKRHCHHCHPNEP